MEIVPPTEPTASHPASAPTGNRKIACEFCKCQLTPNGEYLSLSEEARTFRDQAETIRQLRADLTAGAELLARAERERDEAKAALAVPSATVRRGPFAQ